MFSGIVDHCACVQEVSQTAQSETLVLKTCFEALEPGESICVDGVCLTVVHPQDSIMTVQVSPETLQLTTLGSVRKGSAVNVERALRFSDRVGGHFVTGHVDKTAMVEKLTSFESYLEMRFTGIQKQDHPLLVKKGSVAVNGVSLTVNEVDARGFEVMLIPHTLERTNLKELGVGSTVNIEFDWMAKMVSQQVQLYMQERENS